MEKTGFLDFFRKRQNLTACVMCVAGTLLNLLLSGIAAALNLHLYLDTVGTVAIAIMGGYLPGVIVGFATNAVRSFFNSSALYYGIFNVIIAVVASLLAGRKWHRKTLGLLGMAVSFTLIGGGMGSVVSLFIEGMRFSGDSLSGIIYESGLVGERLSHVVSGVIIDLPDKLISVIIAAVIVRLIPEEYHCLFSLRGWQQRTVSDEELLDEGRTGVRRISLQTKMLFALGASLLIVSMVALVLGASVYKKTIINDHRRIAQGTANIVAAVIDGDRIDDYLESEGKRSDYQETEVRLKNILSNSTEISYLYVYKIDEEGCHVVFDLEANGVAAEEVGTVIPFDEEFSDFIPELLAGKEIEPIITNDRYGYLLTAYSPVYDSKGNCACYVGVDVDMQHLGLLIRSFFVEVASVFLAFFILICAIVIWGAEYHIIIPINSIMRCMDRIARTSDTQESMDEDVKLFRKLGIHTGDEVENLYLSACRMTKNQAEQMRSIRRLSDSTAKMQDGLIITMADLVESRDSDTGAHAQKTSAYVKIIVEGLKKKGYYANKITPKFMSDVVRSAPLHDIGKIHIPDEILNKPDKLSEEEYEIMKTHTTAGKRIMENAISIVEGDNYLKEARNMAAYHHERWDGKGYPEGIHGEVIPLSARIMAVADVFDALTSPRVYKTAVPFDEALSALKAGMGTQFDPKCVEAFMDSLPEVKVILQKYNERT